MENRRDSERLVVELHRSELLEKEDLCRRNEAIVTASTIKLK